MKKFFQDNYAYILLVVMVFIMGLYGIFYYGKTAIKLSTEIKSKKVELQTKEENVAKLEAQKLARIERRKKKPRSGKVLLELPSAQFSAEASFGIMFDNILSSIAKSGVRVRSIEYNYSPADDKVLAANIPGNNACELSFIAVGNYAQFQQFFKDITKEKYIVNIYEIYIEPYDYDKNILVSRFKVRLYTKSV